MPEPSRIPKEVIEAVLKIHQHAANLAHFAQDETARNCTDFMNAEFINTQNEEFDDLLLLPMEREAEKIEVLLRSIPDSLVSPPPSMLHRYIGEVIHLLKTPGNSVEGWWKPLKRKVEFFKSQIIHLRPIEPPSALAGEGKLLRKTVVAMAGAAAIAMPAQSMNSIANLAKNPISIQHEQSTGRAFINQLAGKGMQAIDFNHINFADLGDANGYGRIQRAMRWKSITSYIERKYGLPDNLLVGLLCQESFCGVALLNRRGDGGAGFVHMQPSIAAMKNLAPYNHVTKTPQLRDRKHGEELKMLYEENEGDIGKLSRYDGRFHPAKNLDAAAMLLVQYHRQYGNWKDAVRGYRGYAHKESAQYAEKVFWYAGKASDQEFMARAAADFEKRNLEFYGKGRPLWFTDYLAYFSVENVRWVAEYEQWDVQRKMPNSVQLTSSRPS